MKMLTAITGMVLFSVAVAGDKPYLKVCEDGQTTCFANYYSGEQYTIEWDEVEVPEGETRYTEIKYEVRVVHDDGTIENLGITEVPKMTVTTDRSSNQVFHARSVGNCAADDPEPCVSAWGGLDNPSTTQDGKAWVIIVKPEPPTASFGS